MNKTFLFIVVTVAILGGLIWIARPEGGSSSTAENPISSSDSLIAEANHYDFGTISMKDGLVSHEYKLTNVGEEPIFVTKSYTSCMCTKAELSIGEEAFGPFGMPGHGFTPPVNHELMPSEEMRVIVTFDPNAHGPAGVGNISREVRIETRDHGMARLTFETVVTP